MPREYHSFANHVELRLCCNDFNYMSRYLIKKMQSYFYVSYNNSIYEGLNGEIELFTEFLQFHFQGEWSSWFPPHGCWLGRMCCVPGTRWPCADLHRQRDGALLQPNSTETSTSPWESVCYKSRKWCLLLSGWSLTLKQLGHWVFFFSKLNVILISGIVYYKCNIIVWKWSNTLISCSALWILMAWCFSTRPSVATVLITLSSISSCVWVNIVRLYEDFRARSRYLGHW